MIEFKFPCPSCGQRIQATDAYSGRQINCPACQKPMLVPPAPGSPPPTPARAAATPPPVPAQSKPAAAPVAQRPVPAAKKSTPTWLVVSSAIGVALVSGVIAFLAVSGALFHSHSGGNSSSVTLAKTTAASKVSKATASANQSGPSAAEIAQKVTDQYGALTSYSASGTAVMDMDMSKVDVNKMPGMDKVPAKTKKSKELQQTLSKPVRTESDFTVKLGRPDFYRVEWEMKSGPGGMQGGMKGGVWSAGEGDFISITKTKYTKMESRDLALASATGVSGGVAGTLPAIFFNDNTSQLAAFKQAERAADDTVDGEDCYVLNGEAMGMKMVLWVTKDTFLIKQKQMVFGGQPTMPQMSDAQIDEQLNKMGNLTAAQKAQAKTAMKNMKPMLTQMKGTMTETYRNIEINQPVKKADFKYEVPPGAVLTKSLF